MSETPKSLSINLGQAQILVEKILQHPHFRSLEKIGFWDSARSDLGQAKEALYYMKQGYDYVLRTAPETPSMEKLRMATQESIPEILYEIQALIEKLSNHPDFQKLVALELWEDPSILVGDIEQSLKGISRIYEESCGVNQNG